MLVADVLKTLTALDLTPADHAAQALALELARQIDAQPEPADFARFSAQLASLLAELGATPASRARIASHKKADADTSQTVNPLAAFRAGRGPVGRREAG